MSEQIEEREALLRFIEPQIAECIRTGSGLLNQQLHLLTLELRALRVALGRNEQV